VSGPATAPVGRIPSGGLRQLGPINWVVAKLAARTVRAPEMHLFTTLGQRQTLFWAWSFYGGRLLRGRLPRIDTELVILRVAHLRSSEYELQHHRGMARQEGLDASMQAAIFAWPDLPAEAAGKLSARQQALLQATDELIKHRTITADNWQQLAGHLNRRQLIEFCLLATNYDGLAATISALDIPLDNPRTSYT
jgi:alkylhydroperoxidase family enzyme